MGDFDLKSMLKNIFSDLGQHTQTEMQDKIDEKMMEKILDQNNNIESLEKTNMLQSALISIYQLAIIRMSMEAKLQQALDVIISIPLLDLLMRGGIYVLDKNPGELILKAQSNLPEEIKKTCPKILFGQGVCGRAAVNGKLIYATELEINQQFQCKGKYPGMGHYSIPIANQNRSVIGLISLFTKQGHQSTKEIQEYLTTISAILAGIIEARYFK